MTVTQRPRLQGAPNFRDLGGLTAADGRCIRTGRIYRSGFLAALTPADSEILAGFGIRLICDLRSHKERSHWPTRLSFEVEHAHYPVPDPLPGEVRRGDDGFWGTLRAAPNAQGARRAMLNNYRDMPSAFAGILPPLFARLLQPGLMPAVIHCHAGKDRTGFACAMILAALDVEEPLIIDDYLATRAFYPADPGGDPVIAGLALKQLGFALDAAALAPIEAVEPAYLAAAFDSVRDGFGSVARYLHEVAGLDETRREQLRALLLE